MNNFFHYFFIMIFLVCTIDTSVGMQELLVRKRFEGHELTALALLVHSNEKEDSLFFIDAKQIIAVFNYPKQKVITYLDDENHYELSYEAFSTIMSEYWQPGELRAFQERSKNSEESENVHLRKAYEDSCACCIS